MKQGRDENRVGKFLPDLVPEKNFRPARPAGGPDHHLVAARLWFQSLEAST